ncbi:WD40 repeat domain-containing protein [Terrihabitans sp. B22-R8]|uniref:WD40 repeat domain-containing protein n=1 Tax=Terrihabitans sp. B22-R8 TaxID=3425128 RepID=UPI00403C4E07
MSAADSLSSFIVPVAAEAHVSAVGFLGDTAAFALGDGTIVLARDGVENRVPAHPDGAVLVAAFDGRAIYTGGDDGRLVRTDADGTMEEIADTGGQWIDALALGPDNAVAWSAGRKVRVRDGKGAVFGLELTSTARGLTFAAKGFQLIIARYDGASLWFPRSNAPLKDLTWKGSHIGITASADGRFVVSTMQENALHGWRLADGAHMRMSGYPAKTRSVSWSPDGKWLATSGADAAIVWPFVTKDGPMGKPPLELAVRQSRVEQVAFHPRAPVLAVGYLDGCILLAKMDDDAQELLVRPALDGGPVTALGWDRMGTRLAFGTRDGAAGVLPLPKLT